MTVLYLDTSALLKRYVAEPESEEVRTKLDEALVIATAVITRTEVAAALSRAQRDGRTEASAARQGEREFLEDWRDFGKVPVTEELASHAAELAFPGAVSPAKTGSSSAGTSWFSSTPRIPTGTSSNE